MNTTPNRHYVSTHENRELVQNYFNVEYVLDPLSMRWVHDYETPEGLEAAQEYLFNNSPWKGGTL
jgi:hypothetical protein